MQSEQYIKNLEDQKNTLKQHKKTHFHDYSFHNTGSTDISKMNNNANTCSLITIVIYKHVKSIKFCVLDPDKTNG